MARSLNKAIIIGNLGSDPEIRTTGGGQKVAQFSVATSRKWTNQQGEQQEKTEWHRIVVWGKLADVVERYLKKGNSVYIEGEIQYRSYEDKDGVTKYTTEINARDLLMLGGREGGGGDYEGGGSSGGFNAGGRGQGRAAPAPAASGRAGAGSGAARGAAAGGRGGKGGGNDYDDFEAPPLDDDDDLPF